MKKYLLLLILIFLITGCATYKFQRGEAPNDKGYVVARDGYSILEYSIGKDNSVPERQLAKERFQRRRNVVEHYYKRMGYIKNHFTMTFWDPVIMSFKMLAAIFRLPGVAISEYRYENNPAYREKIKQREAQRDSREERRIKNLKQELDIYIQRDIAAEKSKG